MIGRTVLRAWILVFTFSIVSLGSTSSVMVFPVSVFTKICILRKNLCKGAAAMTRLMSIELIHFFFFFCYAIQ